MGKLLQLVLSFLQDSYQVCTRELLTASLPYSNPASIPVSCQAGLRSFIPSVRHFIHQAVDAGAALARQLFQALVLVVWQADGEGGHAQVSWMKCSGVCT